MPGPHPLNGLRCALEPSDLHPTGDSAMEPAQPDPTIEAERLVLRPIQPEDAGDIQRLAGEFAIADTTLNMPHPYEEGMAEEWIARQQKSIASGETINWGIRLRETDELIGVISLEQISLRHRNAVTGYWIATGHWGRGYATEALKAVLGFAFETLDLNKVHCEHFTRNPASGRVMRKAGMRHEGTRRAHVERWGKFEDLELYGILKSDWSTSRN